MPFQCLSPAPHLPATLCHTNGLESSCLARPCFSQHAPVLMHSCGWDTCPCLAQAEGHAGFMEGTCSGARTVDNCPGLVCLTCKTIEPWFAIHHEQVSWSIASTPFPYLISMCLHLSSLPFPVSPHSYPGGLPPGFRRQHGSEERAWQLPRGEGREVVRDQVDAATQVHLGRWGKLAYVLTGVCVKCSMSTPSGTCTILYLNQVQPAALQ